MKYFVVLGKNRGLSLQELEMIKPQNIVQKGNIILLDIDNSDKLKLLAGITKFGKVISIDELPEILSDAKIFGTNNEALGRYIKKNIGVRRYKFVDNIGSDLEIKDSGQEIMLLDKDFTENPMIGQVSGYQDIPFYEAIDFSKPVSGMQIGMMPSKLTHMLINIGLSRLDKKENITIYDPFVGFGTTGFVANHLGYDFIGSDINITSFKQNIAWREKNPLSTKSRMTDFKHDINEPLKKPFLKNVDLIVTEGWLGHVISHKTRLNELKKFQSEIIEVYKSFVSNIDMFWDQIVAVFTVPVYFGKDMSIVHELEKILTDMGLEYECLQEIYHRKGQSIGRAVFILKKS